MNKKVILKNNVTQRFFSKPLFFKFTIDKEEQENLIFSLVDIELKFCFNLRKMRLWKNEGLEQVEIEEENDKFCSELAQIKCTPGEYLCMFEIEQTV